MPFSPPIPGPSHIGARFLNALLGREPWARERLARHSGKTVRLSIGPVQAQFSIRFDGRVNPADPAIVPDVTLTIPSDRLGELPGVLAGSDHDALPALLHVQGEAALATTVSELARNLRWDPEDELAAWVGDILALRLVNTGRSFAHGARVAGRRLGENLSEYLTEESRMILSRAAYEEWTERLEGALERLDTLEGRVQVMAAPGMRAGGTAGG